MRIAITGGSGFVGAHLAEELSQRGHHVVILTRGIDHRPLAQRVMSLPGVSLIPVSVDDVVGLTNAMAGCDAVAHCAGINREIGLQTYDAVHIQGTRNVVRAAETAKVGRIVFVSFLRARPDCGSAYHESKWAAEEIVRAASCPWTILKPGMIYGHGDHMLDHLSHALYTFPVYVGIGNLRVRPLAVGDVVDVLVAALVDRRLTNETVALVGPTEIKFDDAARLVADVIGKRRLFLRAPLAFHRALAWVSERTMTVPLLAAAQVQILKEQVVESVRAPDSLPSDLTPRTTFDEKSVREGLPAAGRFGLADLRSFSNCNRESHGAVLVYDGDCGFCTSAAKWTARRFQHGERVEPWQLLGDDFLAKNRLSSADVHEAAWWIDNGGLRERGHRAVGRALLANGGIRRTIGWFVLTPPTSWLARGVYGVVVRWRYRLPGGTPACKVDPSRPKV